MTSYCLTLHHLGSIKAKLGDLEKAIELLTKAKVLAPKYVKEKEVRMAISANLKACEEANTGPSRYRRQISRKGTGISRPEPVRSEPTVSETKQKRGASMPSAESLVEEILLEESKGKKKKKKDVSMKTLPALPVMKAKLMGQKPFMTLDMPQIQSSNSNSMISENSDIDVSRSSRSRITIKTPRSHKTSREDSKDEIRIGERSILKAIEEEDAHDNPSAQLFTQTKPSTPFPKPTNSAGQTKPGTPIGHQNAAPPILQPRTSSLSSLGKAAQTVTGTMTPQTPKGIMRSDTSKTMSVLQKESQITPPPPADPPPASSSSLSNPSKVQINKDMQRLREIESKAAETIQKYAKRYITKKKHQPTLSVGQSDQPPDTSLLLDDLDESQDMEMVIPSKNLFPLTQESKIKSPAFGETPRLTESNSSRARGSNPPSLRTIPIRLSQKEPPSAGKEFKKTQKRKELLQFEDTDESSKKPILQVTRPYDKVRRRAVAQDYLSLKAPEIHIRKRLHPESFPYNWKLSLREITYNRSITFHLECFGEGLSFADNIYCELPVEVDLDQLSDYRIMVPFDYETIWPVVCSSFENMTWDGEEYTAKEVERIHSESEIQWLSASHHAISSSFLEEDFNHDDAASDRVRFTLENILDRYQLVTKVTGKTLGPLTRQEEESLESEEHTEMMDVRDCSDGVFKQLVCLVMHHQDTAEDVVRFNNNVNIPVEETIFERGVAKLELGYFLLVLTMTPDFSMLQEGFQTGHRSYVLLELNSTTSDWREVIPISWESIEVFFRTLGYKMPLGYILKHGKLPQVARDLLYQHLPSIIQISQSSITVDFSNLRKGTESYVTIPTEEDIFATSSVKPVIVTDVNWIEREESVDWDLVLPGTVYSSAFTIADYTKKLEEDEAILILNRTRLQGGKDMLHIKMAFTQSKKLSIDAWNMRTEDCYRFIQGDEETIKFLVRLCEENSMCGRLIVQSTLRLERTMHGTMLVSKQKSWHETDLLREMMYRRLGFLNREIRTIGGTLCIVCFYTSDRGMRLEIYDYTSGKLFLVALSDSDFDEYFRNLSQLVPGIKLMLLKRESIHAPVAQAIREFFYPLAQHIIFERSLTGTRLIWRAEEERRKDDALRLKNAKLSAKQFKFLDKQQISISKTLKMRSLADAIINRMLGFEAEGLLVKSNNEFQVVLQRTKIVKGRLGVLSVLRHTLIEEWRLHLYLPSTCRSFQSRLYDSDLYGISAEALDITYPDSNHIVNSVRLSSKAWELILAQCSFEEMRGMLFFQFDNISTPMVEVIYSAIIEKNYSANETSGVLYAEVVVKHTSDTAGPFEEFPVLHDLREARTKLSLSIRAYSFSKRIWVKQSLSLDEGVRLLLREQKLEESILVQPRFVFAFVKELSNLLFKVVKLKAKMRTANKDMSLPDITAVARSRDESLDPMVGKDDWRNIDESITEKEERLYLTIVHSIPVTLGGVFLNVYRDEFVIRVYRPGTGESYRKAVRRKEMRNLITEVDFLLEKGMQKSLGIRIIQLLLPRVLSKISLST